MEEMMYEEQKRFFEGNQTDLEDEFIKTLAPEEQPKTDDVDERESIIEDNRDDFNEYVEQQFHEALNNGWDEK